MHHHSEVITYLKDLLFHVECCIVGFPVTVEAKREKTALTFYLQDKIQQNTHRSQGRIEKHKHLFQDRFLFLFQWFLTKSQAEPVF